MQNDNINNNNEEHLRPLKILKQPWQGKIFSKLRSAYYPINLDLPYHMYELYTSYIFVRSSIKFYILEFLFFIITKQKRFYNRERILFIGISQLADSLSTSS